VGGTCPHCEYEYARGDQCEKCGRLLDSTNLIQPRCTICGSSPEIRTSKHWFFDLPRFSGQIEKYLRENRNLSNNARNFSLGLIKEGLRPRSITRDNKWGIQAPFPGSEEKTIYVWIEAVLGYLSATIEYFENKDGCWEDYWLDKKATSLFFIGKDNIPFHTIILPALLLATHEEYNLPGSVSSTEFLLFEKNKFSKSRRVGVWIDEALDLFPLDYWRYTLISIRPETKDTSFTWRILLEKINSDLNANLGNFIHRTTTFVNNYFGGSIPEVKELTDYDSQTILETDEKIKRIAESIERFRLQEALGTALSISQLGNRYLNKKEPWKTIKSNPQASIQTLYVAVQIVKSLVTAFQPFIPSFSKKLSNALNLSENIHGKDWDAATKHLLSGHKIEVSKTLFEKILVGEEELQEKLRESRSI